MSLRISFLRAVRGPQMKGSTPVTSAISPSRGRTGSGSTSIRSTPLHLRNSSSAHSRAAARSSLKRGTSKCMIEHTLDSVPFSAICAPANSLPLVTNEITWDVMSKSMSDHTNVINARKHTSGDTSSQTTCLNVTSLQVGASNGLIGRMMTTCRTAMGPQLLNPAPKLQFLLI
jgi:hypothetical protein